jgi:membrane protein YqaA with SNARE-associated domain
LIDFLISTAASVLGGIIAYYVCKALEGNKKR